MFFTLRRLAYLRLGLEGGGKSTFRHAIRNVEIAPMLKAEWRHWGQAVDSASLHLAGGETDWLNSGRRKHTGC